MLVCKFGVDEQRLILRFDREEDERMRQIKVFFGGEGQIKVMSPLCALRMVLCFGPFSKLLLRSFPAACRQRRAHEYLRPWAAWCHRLKSTDGGLVIITILNLKCVRRTINPFDLLLLSFQLAPRFSPGLLRPLHFMEC
jgi:hypothetical protein